MTRYITTRILLFVIVMFLIITFTYFATSMTMLNVLPSEFGFFDFMKIVSSRYVEFIKNIIFSWDWGIARNRQDAWELLLFRMPRTLRIVLVTYVVSLIIGLLLGILSAYNQNNFIDKMITLFTLVFGSVPNFVLIFAFMLIFGYHLEWFPPIPPPESEGLIEIYKSIIIPVMALSLMPIAIITSLIRSEFREIKEIEYSLLLKTKGMSDHQMIMRHHLKNVFIPILPEIAATFSIVLTGSFIFERISNTAGIAALLMNSLLSPMMGAYYFNIDINVTVLVCAFYAFMSMFFVLIADILLAILDPRIKIGGKKK